MATFGIPTYNPEYDPMASRLGALTRPPMDPRDMRLIDLIPQLQRNQFGRQLGQTARNRLEQDEAFLQAHPEIAKKFLDRQGPQRIEGSPALAGIERAAKAAEEAAKRSAMEEQAKMLGLQDLLDPEQRGKAKADKEFEREEKRKKAAREEESHQMARTKMFGFQPRAFGSETLGSVLGAMGVPGYKRIRGEGERRDVTTDELSRHRDETRKDVMDRFKEMQDRIDSRHSSAIEARVRASEESARREQEKRQQDQEKREREREDRYRSDRARDMRRSFDSRLRAAKRAAVDAVASFTSSDKKKLLREQITAELDSALDLLKEMKDIIPPEELNRLMDDHARIAASLVPPPKKEEQK